MDSDFSSDDSDRAIRCYLVVPSETDDDDSPHESENQESPESVRLPGTCHPKLAPSHVSFSKTFYASKQ